MGPAFRLEVDPDGFATLTFDLPERRANIFTREVLAELEGWAGDLSRRGDLRALTLRSAKPDIFIAGADVDEIAGVTDSSIAAEGSRFGQRLFASWEALPFPTFAAIRGTCVGGGTELALACRWILLSDRPDLRIGLPETQLGILPGWGGCVRLPRRVGQIAALDIILAGRSVSGRRARAIGLADDLLPDAGFDRFVADFVRTRFDRPRPRRRRGVGAALLEGNPIGRAFVFRRARRQLLARTRGRYPAPLRALEVVAEGLSRGRDAGFAAEARAIGELAVSGVAKNLIHLFRLAEAARKDGGAEPATEIRRPGVLGAGVMGGGIAALIAEKAGLAVRIEDVRPEPLATALAHAAALYTRQLERGRLGRDDLRRRMGLLQPTLGGGALGGCDLVIEAIVENLEIKQGAFADLGRRTAPTAILASNTSSLSIDAIGRDAASPDRIVGMHFFNPVDRMPLVEVVAGPRTSRATTRAVAAFARRLGKTPVIVRDGPGFLVNRLLAFYSAEALWLVDEGYRIEDVDRAMVEWGMPMGPLRLADEVGLDVSAKVGHVLHGAFGDRLPFPAWLDRLAGAGRLGAKSGKGIYRYHARHPRGVDPAVYDEIGIRPSRSAADLEALAERLVLPMVNEAARCLAEGIVDGPGPLDLAMILGTGFPPFRGGLCRWADSLGLAEILRRLEGLAAKVGARLAPSGELRAAAAHGGFYGIASLG